MFAQIVPVDAPALSPAIWDFLLVGGVVAVLAVIIFIVAAVVRRPQRHRSRTRRGPEILRNTEEHLREQAERNEAEPAAEEAGRQRRKRRRRDHRPRNPTLAEAGGLPPERDPDTVPNQGL
jgi:hypothetical protein